MADQEIVAHWHILLDDFNTSALNFYEVVEKALTARKIPDLKVSRVTWKEGGLFSAKREYLNVKRGELIYDICAAPFGSGYFFSSWMAVEVSNLMPALLKALVKPETRYSIDTRLMFQASVHRAVTDAIGSLRSAQGLRALSPDELKPNMAGMFGSAA